MPANVVKTPTDEKHWREAKKAYEDAVSRGKKPANKWAYIMDVFERMKHGSGGPQKTPHRQAASVLEALAAELSTAGTINDPEYTHYIWCQKQNKILSGWSYPEDAKDALRDLPKELGPCRVLSKRYLKQINLDPDNDASWGSDQIEPAAPAPAAPAAPGMPADEPPLPDERAIDEMQFRQKWEGAVAHFEATAANPSKNDVLQGLQEIKKAMARFGELHWNDAQQFLGQKAQRLIDAVEAINETIKALGGGAKQTLAPSQPGAPKKDFGTGPKPEMEFAPEASFTEMADLIERTSS